MGWFLWGVAIGWALCIGFNYSQRGEDADTTSNGALIVLGLLVLVAFAISIGLSKGAAIAPDVPTPTNLGR